MCISGRYCGHTLSLSSQGPNHLHSLPFYSFPWFRAPIKDGETKFKIGVPTNELKPLGSSSDYVLTGNTSTRGQRHLDNHYLFPTVIPELAELAAKYKIKHDNYVLEIDDNSIKMGGIFDLDADFMPPHSLHRVGLDADIIGDVKEGVERAVDVKWLVKNARFYGARRIKETPIHFRFFL